ncbi:MAG: hypothetical protein ACJAT2_001600 [Bacteriovoracaceae bacterium]|jgi:hypothetical protein
MEIPMKLALIILGLFFLSLTVRSRELTLSERGVLLGLQKSSEIKTYMTDKIIKTDLSMRDYIGFLALRRACDPVNILVRHIEKQDENFKDQSKSLAPLMNACEKGSLGLTHLYIGQNH